MELYIFRRDEYDRLYRCSYMSDEEWFSKGIADPIFGTVVIVLGVLLTLPYIPCLIVIFKSSLYKYSAYKLMFYVGVSDVACLLVNSSFSGIFTINGSVGCPGVTLKYFVGTVGLAAWASQSVSVVLLALNRWIEIAKPRPIIGMFHGRRVYFWIFLTIIYSFYYFLFIPAPIFSSYGHAWYFDPYYSIEDLSWVDKRPYGHTLFVIHNFSLVALLPLIYGSLLVYLWWISRHGGARMSRLQAVMTIQSFFVCFFTLVTSFIYGYMQLVIVPTRFGQIATITWQLSNGGPAIIYLLVNKTIRKGVRGLFTFQRNEPSESDHTGISPNTNGRRISVLRC
ncbi:hypothetical protein QR680_015825 [Steinernema hermaphroditum]|uniref:Uncharacterized protein n=1 Tax=Steinernema hermaphroditum TaxID=289476 RepID=A0AA39HAX9_9BILA|nr:hypothetical protein QR680_015825 [Steinernema hermaphroditum]